MKIYVPEYYEKFKCIADKCSDNCCVGWGIDVDSSTVEKYKSLPSNFRDDVISSIDFSNGACFKCDKNGRCKNLDDRGLCRIISTLGEGYLCQICRDHPRYFNLIGDRWEGGLGVACEVAADMILSMDRLPGITEVESPDVDESVDQISPFAISARDYLLSFIFESNFCSVDMLHSLVAKASVIDDVLFDIICGDLDENTPAESVLGATDAHLSLNFAEMLSAFDDIEPLTSDFAEKARGAKEFAIKDKKRLEKLINEDAKIAIRNLAYYFLHRYFLSVDYGYRECVLFAAASAILIVIMAHLDGGIGHQNLILSAKSFSKNIEYSTENVEKVLENLTDIQN